MGRGKSNRRKARMEIVEKRGRRWMRRRSEG